MDTEHGEMTLLVSKEKVKFNLHQSILVTDDENNCCMRIESSLLPFEEQAPKILKEETLEGYKLETNSFPTKELDFELTSPILRWRSSYSRAMRMKREYWPQRMEGQSKALRLPQ